MSVGFQINWTLCQTSKHRDKCVEVAHQGALRSTLVADSVGRIKTAQSLQPGLTAIALITPNRCDEKSDSSFALSGNIEMLSIAKASDSETQGDEPNLTLAPEEIATLTSLMESYDQVLVDIDALNDRLQELLDMEGSKSVSGKE